MTDITNLWMYIPSQLAILHDIIAQCIGIEGLNKLIQAYLIPHMDMVHSSTTREIELSTPLTFTLQHWRPGINCNTVDVKCIYPHEQSLFCARFIAIGNNNLDAYRSGMKRLLDIIKLCFPSLGVRQFRNRIDVVTNEVSSLDRVDTVSDRVIVCTSVHISGSILHPNWKLQPSSLLDSNRG